MNHIALVLLLTITLFESPTVADLNDIVAEIEADETCYSGLQHALSFFDRFNGELDPRWKRIVVRCNALVVSTDTDTQFVAAKLLARISRHFPEFANECRDSLIKGLDHATARNKCEIISAIGCVPFSSKTAVERLREEINENKVNGLFFSIRAATSIAQVSPDKVERVEMIKWLQSRLNDRREYVRWMCADGLGIITKGAEMALDDLRRLLKDANATVRASAARAIWRIAKDDAPVVKILVATLRAEETSYFVRPISPSEYQSSSRMLALQSLCEIGLANETTIDAIAELLGSDEISLRREAIFALAKLPLRSISNTARVRIRKAAQTDSDSSVRKGAESLFLRIAAGEEG